MAVMDIITRRREADELLQAVLWLRDYVCCDGPLGHLPSSDPAVKVVCHAIRHLTNRHKEVCS